MNDKDYFLLNEFICSRYDSCDKCPLNKYGDCDVEPTSHEVVEIAKRISDLPNSDELALSQKMKKVCVKSLHVIERRR